MTNNNHKEKEKKKEVSLEATKQSSSNSVALLESFTVWHKEKCSIYSELRKFEYIPTFEIVMWNMLNQGLQNNFVSGDKY